MISIKAFAIFLMLASSAVPVAPASATSWVAVTQVGPPPSPAEQRRAERKRRRDSHGQQKLFRYNVVKGNIDSATGLAEILIPNVHGWTSSHEMFSDGDHDAPFAPAWNYVATAFTGTDLEGLNEQQIADIVPPSFVREHIYPYDRECNREFRIYFSYKLQLAFSNKSLDNMFIRLSKSGVIDKTYFKFRDNRRLTRPYLAEETRQSNTMFNDPSNPIVRTLDAFWDQKELQLGDPSLICPVAYRYFLIEREIIMVEIRKQRHYAYFRDMAKAARASNGAPLPPHAN
jgi:hypothetical protein